MGRVVSSGETDDDGEAGAASGDVATDGFADDRGAFDGAALSRAPQPATSAATPRQAKIAVPVRSLTLPPLGPIIKHRTADRGA